jgi:hypothetical protein
MLSRPEHHREVSFEMDCKINLYHVANEPGLFNSQNRVKQLNFRPLLHLNAILTTTDALGLK